MNLREGLGAAQRKNLAQGVGVSWVFGIQLRPHQWGAEEKGGWSNRGCFNIL
ncbi:MAG: hypothetical protein RRB13_07285 [bacterium]|nr:hypothetical protein [bacterium]